ncbi:hypothetical protein H6G94_00110 [Nostoc punctiforme FACHB-252]|jgi:hypothetical protein|uniref:Uncharacterized protein n=1 Tax=Nostoc punctiforme FACHB-252 TaxID=1357509 RepID=A0ABR8H2D4_NOSPU|nr:hypothetical protein [Nostoc punctiforme]MBD2609689.1 hypothetical protein [Nostoc punctiforme FACHB-252]
MASLKRRQFGQLAAASLTSTVVAGLSTQAVAQKADTKEKILYAVNLLSASNTQNRENQTPGVELNTADLVTGRILSKVNRLSLAVENPLAVTKNPRAFFLNDYSRITKAIVLKNGTLVISTVSSTKNGYFNHLLFTIGSATIPVFGGRKVLGFKRANQTVESLLSLPNNQLLCLVGTEGVPPFSFRTLDFTTGRVFARDELALPSLPPTHRFSNLCQDLKGNIFATEIGSEGFPCLISMNLQEKALITGNIKIKRLTPLTFEGRPLSYDLQDLTFSSDGQLYALAADSNRKNTAVYTVDVKSGKMGLLRNFAAEKFAFL